MVRENNMIISGHAGTDRRSSEVIIHMEEQAGFSDFDFSSFTNGFGGIEDIFDILSDVLDRFYNTSFDILMSKYNRKNK